MTRVRHRRISDVLIYSCVEQSGTDPRSLEDQSLAISPCALTCCLFVSVVLWSYLRLQPEHDKGRQHILIKNRVKMLHIPSADGSDFGRQTPTGQIGMKSQIKRYIQPCIGSDNDSE
jgi:hypothetical protein